jgi:hypothetical protein
VYCELGCTLTVWVHWALSLLLGVAFSALLPECTGLETVVPEPAEQVQFDSPVSKPELATRLVVAAPAEPEFTRATPPPITAAALSPATVRRITVLLRLVWRD